MRLLIRKVRGKDLIEGTLLTERQFHEIFKKYTEISMKFSKTSPRLILFKNNGSKNKNHYNGFGGPRSSDKLCFLWFPLRSITEVILWLWNPQILPWWKIWQWRCQKIQRRIRPLYGPMVRIAFNQGELMEWSYRWSTWKNSTTSSHVSMISKKRENQKNI